MAVNITFSEQIAPITSSVLTLTNLTTQTAVPTSSIHVDYDPITHTAHFTFPGYANGVLPDGNYRAVLPAGGVADVAGNPTAADYVLNFFVLAGDANGDRVVNGTDASIAGGYYNSGLPATWSQGDFNYDGRVDDLDMNILRANYRKTLP
jgi:hypothetical protein